MDTTAKRLLQQGGQEALILSLCDKMVAIKEIIDAVSEKEWNVYCQHYEGFYEYMALLEQLAIGCS